MSTAATVETEALRSDRISVPIYAKTMHIFINGKSVFAKLHRKGNVIEQQAYLRV